MTDDLPTKVRHSSNCKQHKKTDGKYEICQRYSITYKTYIGFVFHVKILLHLQSLWIPVICSGIILFMCPANKRQCYIVMSSLIGWAHTQNDPCIFHHTLQGCFSGTGDIIWLKNRGKSLQWICLHFDEIFVIIKFCFICLTFSVLSEL